MLPLDKVFRFSSFMVSDLKYFTKMTSRSEGKSIASIASMKGETLNTLNNIWGILPISSLFVIVLVTFSTEYKDQTLISKIKLSLLK